MENRGGINNKIFNEVEDETDKARIVKSEGKRGKEKRERERRRENLGS